MKKITKQKRKTTGRVVKKSNIDRAQNQQTIKLSLAQKQADAAINALIQISFDANTALVGVRGMLLSPDFTHGLGSIPLDFRNLCEKLFRVSSEVNGLAHIMLRDLKIYCIRL